MHEYALLNKDCGAVVNVVMTGRPMAEVQKDHPGFEVRPLEKVPQRALLDYRYWNERP